MCVCVCHVQERSQFKPTRSEKLISHKKNDKTFCGRETFIWQNLLGRGFFNVYANYDYLTRSQS